MNQIQIIKTVLCDIKNSTLNESSGHDWWHINRVYNTAMQINKNENGNEFVIGMIALLHDIYDHKFYSGDVQNKLKEKLIELGVYEYISPDDLENITYSCANLGFSENLKKIKPISLEGKIVQDADRLDAIGAIGIARTFAYGGKKNKMMHNPLEDGLISEEEYKLSGSKTSISHFYDKLLKVKNFMNTDTGKKIAIQRTKYMEDFLTQFYSEWNGKDLSVDLCKMEEPIDYYHNEI